MDDTLVVRLPIGLGELLDAYVAAKSDPIRPLRRSDVVREILEVRLRRWRAGRR